MNIIKIFKNEYCIIIAMKDPSSNSHVIYQTPSSTNSRKRATGGDGRNEFPRTMLKYTNNIIHI